MAVKVTAEKVIATIGAGRGQSIKIRDVTFEKVGRRLDVRRYFVDEGDVESPTQKGISLRPEHFDELRRAMAEFEAEPAPK